MLLADLRDYVDTQDRVDALYLDAPRWAEKAILNVARAGKFSSDRAIREYASDIWRVRPCEVADAASPPPDVAQPDRSATTAPTR